MISHFKKINLLLHPFALWEFTQGRKDKLHDIILIKTAKKLLGVGFKMDIALSALHEIKKGNFIPMNQKENIQLPGNKPGHLFGKFLYFIVRCAKPEVMIETGVAHGVSSWTILNAMHKNGSGMLYSIDLPNLDLKSYNPATIQQSSGWVVPEILRSRWELQLGPSSELLPALVNRLKKFDIFLHDSDHSYENMMFEFKSTFPSLAKGGLLISDDVHKNTSFEEFANAHAMNGIKFFTKGGAAVK